MNTNWKITFNNKAILSEVIYVAPGILDAIQQFVENNYSIKDIIKVELSE